MIIGTGIDIAKVERFSSWVDNPGILKRFFHENEVLYIDKQQKTALQSIAGRFAAKEAFGKALGTGLAGLSLKNISIENNEKGKPEIFPKKEVLQALNKKGNVKIHLSIAHEIEFAIAMVILEIE